MTVETIDIPTFHARLKAQGVPTREDLAFKCPMCGTVQSMGDLIDTGMTPAQAEKYVGFSCVGRFNGAGEAKKGKPAPGKFGCNWTLGGLFQLHKLAVINKEGEPQPTFEIASAEEATSHALARAERKTVTA